ncbi:MAG: hypothetical protein J6Y80_04830, partial [Victivallales bacterium]|nr:hypothetical protein [Victivallales bacterium]
ADICCRVWLNGRFLADGPVEVGFDFNPDPDRWPRNEAGWWFKSRVPLEKYAHVGKNELFVEVWPGGLACNTSVTYGQPGFWAEVHQGKKVVVTTDSTWKVMRDQNWSNGDYLYGAIFSDGAKSSAWQQAVLTGDTRELSTLEVPEPFDRPLVPAKITAPFGAEPLRERRFPVVVLPGAPQVIQFAWEEHVSAHLEFTIETTGRAVLHIDFAELPGYTHHRMNYISRPGRQTYRVPRLNSFQYVTFTVETADWMTRDALPVAILLVTAHRRGLELPPTTPFETDRANAWMSKIRDCCDRTLRMCSQRMFLDSPLHQEVTACSGDYWIETLMSLVLYGDARLAKADLDRTARLLRHRGGVMFHTSYSLMVVSWLKDYLLYTGDEEFTRECFEATKLVLKTFEKYVGAEGLVSQAPNYMFIDWIADGEITYHHPTAARGMGAMTALYIISLEDSALLAEHFGDRRFASKCRKTAERAREAYRKTLWRKKKRCFADGLVGVCQSKPYWGLPADEARETCTVQNNVLAVLAGVVTGKDAQVLLRRVLQDESLIFPQMYFCHFVFEALRKCNLMEELGFDLLRRWIPGVEEHPTGLKESWHCGDYSHAWGGTPAYQFVHSVVGFEPTAPGCAKVCFL